jgi:hypothetical protein
MIGVYDFCGHYEWTFAWLEAQGGPDLLRAYWDQAISIDSQRHARDLILKKGVAGMAAYWGHTLNQEGAAFHTTATEQVFRIDMHACPSKGFLIRNQLNQHSDYCDHCMGWIGPMMKDAGFVVDHQHNHCGQCWWEFRRALDLTPPSKPGALAGDKDVRSSPDWPQEGPTDTYRRANNAGDKDAGKPD